MSTHERNAIKAQAYDKIREAIVNRHWWNDKGLEDLVDQTMDDADSKLTVLDSHERERNR
jgi:hypothetical protein